VRQETQAFEDEEAQAEKTKKEDEAQEEEVGLQWKKSTGQGFRLLSTWRLRL